MTIKGNISTFLYQRETLGSGARLLEGLHDDEGDGLVMVFDLGTAEQLGSGVSSREYLLALLVTQAYFRSSQIHPHGCRRSVLLNEFGRRFFVDWKLTCISRSVTS